MRILDSDNLFDGHARISSICLDYLRNATWENQLPMLVETTWEVHYQQWIIKHVILRCEILIRSLQAGNLSIKYNSY